MELDVTADDAPPVFTIVGQIERWLRNQITTGALKPGERLPSMTQLQQQFGAKSLSTVREAQLRLIRDGLLEPHQGLGVFVRRFTDDRPDPDAIVRRDVPPRLMSADAETRTVTIELRISPQPSEWDAARFHTHLHARWPSYGITSAPGGRRGYTITITDSDLEDAVAEFDCLIAEANAFHLTVTRPENLAIRQSWQNMYDEVTLQPGGGLDGDHLRARLDRLHPDDPQHAQRVARAADAVTKAHILRTMLESSRHPTAQA